jgi:predicted transcriptional regulator
LRQFASTKISQFIHNPGSIFDPEDLISKALGYMKETGRREVIAIKENKIGVLDVRTLLDVEHPHNLRIDRKWEQHGNVNYNDTFLRITKLLSGNNIWALPVKNGEKVVGIMSHEDIIDGLCTVEELKNIKAKEIARYPVTSVNDSEGIARARRLMIDNDFSQIPVTLNNKLVGIITAENIVHTFISSNTRITRGDRVGLKGSRFDGQIKGIMDSQPYSINEETDLYQIINNLKRLDKTAAIIATSDLGVQGIITKRDLVSLILRIEKPKELPISIQGLTNEDFFERAVAEKKVRRVVLRNMKIHPHISEIRIRIKKQRTQGERSYYMISANAISPNNQFNISHEGWGLLETFDGLCEVLDKSLRRTKKSPQKGARRGRRRPNPHLKL